MPRPRPRPPQRRQLLIIRIPKMLLVIFSLLLFQSISRRISLFQKRLNPPTTIKLMVIKLIRSPLRHKPACLLCVRKLLFSHVACKCIRPRRLQNTRQDRSNDDERRKGIRTDVCACVCLSLFLWASVGVVPSVPSFPVFPSSVSEGAVIEARALAVFLTGCGGVAAGVSCCGVLAGAPACAVGIVGVAFRGVGEDFVGENY